MALGNAEALNNLTVCYEDGDGVKQDIKEAVRLYQLAVNQGHAAAQNNLALWYDNQQNLDEAIHLYKLSAETGNAIAQLPSFLYCASQLFHLTSDLVKFSQRKGLHSTVFLCMK